jgi:hypothetical protein
MGPGSLNESGEGNNARNFRFVLRAARVQGEQKFARYLVKKMQQLWPEMHPLLVLSADLLAVRLNRTSTNCRGSKQ